MAKKRKPKFVQTKAYTHEFMVIVNVPSGEYLNQIPLRCDLIKDGDRFIANCPAVDVTVTATVPIMAYALFTKRLHEIFEAVEEDKQDEFLEKLYACHVADGDFKFPPPQLIRGDRVIN